MIVQMKKVYIIMQPKDAEASLVRLRKIGIIHVEHQQLPQGKDIAALQEEISLVNQALEVLNKYPADGLKQADMASKPYIKKFVVSHIIDLGKRVEQLLDYSRNLKVRISEWEDWGDFDPQKIEALALKNIFVRLYEIPASEINSLPKKLIVKRVFSKGGIVKCAVISRERIDIAYKEILPQKTSLSLMKKKLAEDQKVISMLQQEIEKHNFYKDNILQTRKVLEKDLEFNEALKGAGQSGQLAYLVGYAPVETIDPLLQIAREEKWAMLAKDPGEDDNIPTLLRNPKWVDRVKPVFDLLGIIPGYKELDVSLLFLVFFSIFFGILIGDAGYGMVYSLITFLLHRKWKKNPGTANLISLLYILSLCAIVWGALTGTFFGQEWLIKRGIRPLIPQLNDVSFMQSFCFFLGAFHLSIAHSWRACLKLPSLSALADIGWVCILWSAFFLARTLILASPFPSWGMWLIWAGITLVILFTNPQRNILKAILEGLGTIALSLMNNFTDVVSYVRLFAVGMAGVAIAETANTMASGLGNTSIALAASILIVVIGHALNIILGPMSVLVHGVRLNVLEFSGHASVSWSGIKYQPFKEG